MNVYDSARMHDILVGQGYGVTQDVAQADLVIFNTCHIREKAAEKLYSDLGRMRRVKQLRQEQGADMLIAVAGCVAQAEGAEVVRRSEIVDLVFGPQTYQRLPELIAERVKTGKAIVDIEFPEEDKFVALNKISGDQRYKKSVSAFLTIQEGCDKFCAFCVVPYTRGAEFSRSTEQIVDEAEKMARAGVREITLLGQNVTAWRYGDIGLPRLIARLAQIDGIGRLRYTTGHPSDMNEALIEAHAHCPKLMPYLHLPVQSGSDRILRAMNRGHNAQTYLDIIAQMRRACPDIAVSGDFIVGFPGETEADFEQTLALVRAVHYASAFSFKYSPRPGTPAALIDQQIPEDVKSERLQRLQALLQEQLTAFNHACCGRTLPVLLEKPGRDAGQIAGRSPYLQPVHLMQLGAGQEALKIGDIVNVKIGAIGTYSLSGSYAGSDQSHSLAQKGQFVGSDSSYR